MSIGPLWDAVEVCRLRGACFGLGIDRICFGGCVVQMIYRLKGKPASLFLWTCEVSVSRFVLCVVREWCVWGQGVLANFFKIVSFMVSLRLARCR